MRLPTVLWNRPLDPTPRTLATRRTIAALDRAATRVLRVCWWFINTALWCAVSALLAVERARRRAGLGPTSGVVRTEKGRAFRCMWCGSDTPESETPRLSCCSQEMRRVFQGAS